MELAVLVPDINFLHSNQTLLSKVSSLLASNSNVRFFIPLVVLEELNVHQNSNIPNTSHQAKATISFIEQWIKSYPTLIRDQKPTERLAQTRASKEESILDCCLFVKQNFTPNVAILTADRNLQNMARSHQIAVPVYATAEHLVAEILGNTVPPEAVAAAVTQQQSAIQQNLVSIIDETLSVLMRELPLALHYCFSEYLGEDTYPMLVEHTPPWNLTEMLNLLSKQKWGDVFQELYPRQVPSELLPPGQSRMTGLAVATFYQNNSRRIQQFVKEWERRGGEFRTEMGVQAPLVKGGTRAISKNRPENTSVFVPWRTDEVKQFLENTSLVFMVCAKTERPESRAVREQRLREWIQYVSQVE